VFKVLKSDRNCVVFNTESLDFFPLPSGVDDALLSDEMLISIDSSEPLEANKMSGNPAIISELVFLIAQTCNLKCSYCFAEGYMDSPSYNQIMSPSTARVAIEKLFKMGPDLPSILFFGGEPLIGFDTIKETVQAIKEYSLSHQAQMPALSISTNGTLLNQEMIDFFKDHNFSVTVSLDGPRHINDKQRQFRSGKGTYGIVKNNIDQLRHSGIEVTLEAVFTGNHINCKATIESTYQFLLNFGVRKVCLTPAIGGPPDEYLNGSHQADLEQIYTNTTERIMDSWLSDFPLKIPYWFDILQILLSRKGNPYFCGAGYKRIAIDCSGKVFPCYMVMGDSLFMGNVHDKEFPGEDFRRVTAQMGRISKEGFPKCGKCWARSLCFPCYGDTYAKGGTLSAPSESMCTIIRTVAKTILLKVAEFLTEEEKWKIFLDNVNRLNVPNDIGHKE
jgi:uncharacterized protein